MSITKNQVITAADIQSKNSTLVTQPYSGKGTSKAFGSGDETWTYPHYFRGERGSSTYFNIFVSIENGGGQYTFNLKDSDDNTIISFEDTDDSTTVPAGFDYEYDPEFVIDGVDTEWRIYAPPGEYSIEVDYDDKFLVGAPGNWYMKIKQAQIGMTRGTVIRVWDPTFYELLLEDSTLVNVAKANAGRLGYE